MGAMGFYVVEYLAGMDGVMGSVSGSPGQVLLSAPVNVPVLMTLILGGQRSRIRIYNFRIRCGMQLSVRELT